jgi:CheY-like chemotaxis protein
LVVPRISITLPVISFVALKQIISLAEFGGGLQDLSFLIVEDHDFQRMALERTLRAMGAVSIHSAANGAEAIRLLRARPGAVDIIITDVMMPGVDGIELIAALQKECAGASLLITSANKPMLEMAVLLAKGYGLAVLGALPKPVTPATLRPLLEGYAARPPPVP